MKKTTLAAIIAVSASQLNCHAIDLGGAAATDVSNWTTNNSTFVQGTTDGYAINWENVLTNTAAANVANNHFDLAFETDTNFVIGHLFLYNESLDLSTLPAGGIQTLTWDADFETSILSEANWIPVIAITDAGTTTFYRSAALGNQWNGNDPLRFASRTADSTGWVDLIGDPIGAIDESLGTTNPDFQATTGTIQFGFIQWDARGAGVISPQLDFTTAIEQFDIRINDEDPPPVITELKNSSAFPTKYDGNEIYDGGSYINDWAPIAAGGSVTEQLDVSGENLILTNTDNNGWIHQDNDISPWEVGVSAGGSFTVEARVRLANDLDNGFVIWTGNGIHRGGLQINSNSTQVLQRDQLDSNDNTDDFHVFRLAYDADSGLYFFWRDGVLLTPDGGVAPETNAVDNRLILGDCCSSYLMTSVEIDYVRYDTTGAFAPGPDAPPLEITEITYDQSTHLVTLTWRSAPGEFYAIQGSLDMRGWPIEIDDSSVGAPGADETTISFTAEFNPPVAGSHPRRIFYRVLPSEG